MNCFRFSSTNGCTIASSLGAGSLGLGLLTTFPPGPYRPHPSSSRSRLLRTALAEAQQQSRFRRTIRGQLYPHRTSERPACVPTFESHRGLSSAYGSSQTQFVRLVVLYVVVVVQRPRPERHDDDMLPHASTIIMQNQTTTTTMEELHLWMSFRL